MPDPKISRLERRYLEIGETDPGAAGGLTLINGPIIRNRADGSLLESDNTSLARILTREYSDPTSLDPNGGAAAWVPTDDSVALWLDASYGASIVASGNDLTTLNDRSGNGRNFTAGNSPQTGTRTINSLNVIDFDDTSSQYLQSTAYHPANTFQLIMVATVDAAVQAAACLLRIGGSSRVQIQSINGSFFGAIVDMAGASNVDGSGAGSSLHGAPHIFSLVMDFSGNSWAERADGAEIDAEAAGYQTALNAERFIFFATNSGGPYHNGAFAECHVFENATLSILQKSEGYLADKWNITLDAGHPYAGGPP